MKKFLAALLILVLAMTGVVSAMAEDEVKVMTYEEFAAAELDTEVNEGCRNIFEPREFTLESTSYTIPARAVAVVEIN